MTTLADWFVAAGFLLVVFGIALRVVIMMRSSEARQANATPLAGSDLLRAYRVAHPGSWLPRVTWASLGLGLVFLIAGFLLEMR